MELGDNDNYYSKLPILIRIFCTVELLHCALAMTLVLEYQ